MNHVKNQHYQTIYATDSHLLTSSKFLSVFKSGFCGDHTHDCFYSCTKILVSTDAFHSQVPADVHPAAEHTNLPALALLWNTNPLPSAWIFIWQIPLLCQIPSATASHCPSPHDCFDKVLQVKVSWGWEASSCWKGLQWWAVSNHLPAMSLCVQVTFSTLAFVKSLIINRVRISFQI